MIQGVSRSTATIRPSITTSTAAWSSASAARPSRLGDRLRERIYEDVVPDLAMAIVEARRLRRPTAIFSYNSVDLAVSTSGITFAAPAKGQWPTPVRATLRLLAVLAIAPPLPEDKGGPGMLTADQIAAKTSGMRRGEVP